MKQRDLNRAVAHSTGESVAEIARRGFGPLDELTDLSAEHDGGAPIDWDELEASRNMLTYPRRCRPTRID